MREVDGDLGMINSDMVVPLSLFRRRRCRRVRSHQQPTVRMGFDRFESKKGEPLTTYESYESNLLWIRRSKDQRYL